MRLVYLIGILLICAGCQTKSSRQVEYYPPTEEYSVKTEYTVDGVEHVDIKGPIKKETFIERSGANEFSPGKSFEFSIQGITL